MHERAILLAPRVCHLSHGMRSVTSQHRPQQPTFLYVIYGEVRMAIDAGCVGDTARV